MTIYLIDFTGKSQTAGDTFRSDPTTTDINICS